MYKLFTIFDRESKTYDRPFAAPTARDAKQGFKNAINNKETNFGQFPEDYDLHELGSFDPRSGKLMTISGDVADQLPELICTGKSLVDQDAE